MRSADELGFGWRQVEAPLSADGEEEEHDDDDEVSGKPLINGIL